MPTYRRQSYYDVDTYPFNRINRYEGEFLGRVVDTHDPFGSGAVKVHIPELMVGLPYDQGVWVNMVYVSEGQQTPPTLNQMVIITFRNGEPNLPEYRGIVKFWDNGDYLANPKTTKFPHEDPHASSTDLDSVVYGFAGRNTKINDHYARGESANTYLPMLTPKHGHYDRFMDGDHSFIERKTKNGASLTLCDDAPGGNYALLNAPGDHQFMASDEGYVEMSANNGSHTVTCDAKEKHIVMKSGKNLFVMIDDRTKSVFSISGMNSDSERAAGSSAHILWTQPNDRFAPYIKIRNKSTGFKESAHVHMFSHTVQGHGDMGGLGIGKRGTGRATDYHIRNGFIFLNTF